MINEALEDYKSNIARALAGYVFTKDNDSLSNDEIDRAKEIIHKITSFSDELELSFALDNNDTHAITDILQKYGVAVHNHVIDDSNELVEDNLVGLKHGERQKVSQISFNSPAVVSTFMQWMKAKQIPAIIDNDNNVKFKYRDNNELNIITTAANKIEKNVNYLGTAPNWALRDDINIDEEPIKEGSTKMKGTKNPVAKNLAVTKGSAGAHKVKDKDPWSKKHKHKGKKKELEESKAKCEECGKMECECDNGQLTEAIMGMVQINPLVRLKELAGIHEDPVVDEPMPGIEEPMDMESDIDSDPYAEFSDGDNMSTDDDLEHVEIDSDDDFDDHHDVDYTGEQDFESDIPGYDVDEPDMYSEPVVGTEPDTLASNPVEPMDSSLPMAPISSTPTTGMDYVSNVSPEYQEIQTYMDLITSKVSGLKISEYKMFKTRLDDFYKQVRELGRTYVAENKYMTKESLTEEFTRVYAKSKK